MKEDKKNIYIYPNPRGKLGSDSNNYIFNLKKHLQAHYCVLNNSGTSRGLLDLLLHLNQAHIIYFNWIEELPEKRFSLFQVPLLWVILHYARFRDAQIIWFIHNNVSHTRSRVWLKKRVIQLLRNYSTHICSHSGEVTIKLPENKHRVFPHPIDDRPFFLKRDFYENDILIWGQVSPYKGVLEFLKHLKENTQLQKYSIVIAGRFSSYDYYQQALQYQTSNVRICNKALDQEELIELLQNCKYVLYTYNSASVLSSGALCETLSYGKTTIGPNLGAFKDLGCRNLLFNYNSFEEIPLIIDTLEKQQRAVNQEELKEYIKDHSWRNYAGFVTNWVH